MSTSFTGPVLHRNGAASNPRAVFGGAPVSFQPDYFQFTEDFFSTVNTNVWTAIVTGTATAAISADSKSGLLNLLSDATTDNSGASLQTNEEFVLFDTNAWFFARFANNKVTQSDVFIGLGEAHITTPLNALTAVRAGFQLVDGAADLKFYTKLGSDETSFDTGYDMTNNVFVDVAFKVIGGTVPEIWVYVNSNFVGRTSTYVPTSELAIVLASVSGDNLGTRSTPVDYVAVAAKRVA